MPASRMRSTTARGGDGGVQVEGDHVPRRGVGHVPGEARLIGVGLDVGACRPLAAAVGGQPGVLLWVMRAGLGAQGCGAVGEEAAEHDEAEGAEVVGFLLE